jgi:hypothetical protein
LGYFYGPGLEVKYITSLSFHWPKFNHKEKFDGRKLANEVYLYALEENETSAMNT